MPTRQASSLSKACVTVLLVALALAVLVLAAAGSPRAALLLGAAVVGWLLATRVADRRWASRAFVAAPSVLFLAALAARAWAGIAVWLGASALGYVPWLWFPDGLAFDQMSQKLAAEQLGVPLRITLLRGAYASMVDDPVYVNIYTRAIGRLYAAFGYDPLMPVALNWIAGALAPAFVLLAARSLARERIAVFTAAWAGFLPTTFVWSLFNLREAWIVLCLSIAVWAVPALVRAGRWRAFVVVAPALIVLAQLRFYVGLPALWSAVAAVPLMASGLKGHTRAVMAASMLLLASVVPAALGGGLFGSSWVVEGRTDEGSRPVIQAPPTPEVSATPAVPPAIGAVAATPTAASPTPPPAAAPLVPLAASPSIVLAMAQPPSGAPTGPLFDALDRLVSQVLYRRAGMATYYTESGTRTRFVDPDPNRLCRDSRCLGEVLSVGAVHVLFAPFPWSLSSAQDLVALPEYPFWYGGLTLAIVGCLARWRQWRDWLYAAVLALGTVLVLSVLDVNVGTIVRHRAMLVPELAVLAALGLEVVAQRRNRGATVAAP